MYIISSILLCSFGSLSHTFLDADQSFQILEEPGEDNTKFGNIVPTIVKPKTAEEFNVESALRGHVSGSLIIHCLSIQLRVIIWCRFSLHCT